MRFAKTGSVLAGAVGITLLASSPAMACNDRDPALKLMGECGQTGPAWVVSNPNDFQIPFTWVDNLGGSGKGWAPPQGSQVLTSHGTKVTVTAINPEKGGEWLKHGALGTLTCKRPSKPPTKTPTAKPTTAKPKPTTPEGEAPPAKPVTKTPTFTG
jgi:hypothetical protein